MSFAEFLSTLNAALDVPVTTGFGAALYDGCVANVAEALAIIAAIRPQVEEKVETTYEIEASFQIDGVAPNHFRARASFETEAQAEAEAARFPKFVRAKVLCRHGGGASVWIEVNFGAERGNPKNETGAKRVRRSMQEIGSAYTYRTPYKNSYATFEEFLAAI